MKNIKGAINGFGRFGLHLLKYWIERADISNFSIVAINDIELKKEEIFELIIGDYAVDFSSFKIKLIGSHIQITSPDGNIFKILITTDADQNIPWIGEYDLFFECSGRNTIKKDCMQFLKGRTKTVVISATSWDCDKTLIFGHNEVEFNPDKDKIVSYGSCTVNAYVPLANYLNDKYGVLDSDVNVIHNIQRYRLKGNYTLKRKFCTLETSGKNLLKFLNDDNFRVTYSVIPYEYVSMIDFRFNLIEECSIKSIKKDFIKQFYGGMLDKLYTIDEFDNGPEVHNCTTSSSVFIENGISKIGQNLYLQAYFDNENSVNRYYDVVNMISNKI